MSYFLWRWMREWPIFQTSFWSDSWVNYAANILFYFLYFQLNFFLRIINTLFACRTKNTSFYSDYDIPSFLSFWYFYRYFIIFGYVGRHHKFESLYIFKISFNQTSVTFNIYQYQRIQKSIFYGNAAKVYKVFEV